jgi:ribosome-associated protein
MSKKDSSLALAVAAADLAADGKALDISFLELREISSVADYFVIASGRSHIQVEAICDRIVEGVRDRLGEKPIAVEGLENSQWAVLDYGSVVIHVFQEGARKIYDLERLWSLAPAWKYGEQPPKAALKQQAPKAALKQQPPKAALKQQPPKAAFKKDPPTSPPSKPATARKVSASKKTAAKASEKKPARTAANASANASGKSPAKKPDKKPAGTRSRAAAG